MVRLATQYEYNAAVVRVVDGDTVVLDVDLGFGVWLRDQHFRLQGVNTREHNDPGGAAAAEYLRHLLVVGSPVRIASYKNDKYGGRYDAVVLMLPGGEDLAAHLIEQGWAAPWDGRGERPLPAWPRMAR